MIGGMILILSPDLSQDAVLRNPCPTKKSISLIERIGWGTRSRTSIRGVRVRRPTIERSPNDYITKSTALSAWRKAFCATISLFTKNFNPMPFTLYSSILAEPFCNESYTSQMKRALGIFSAKMLILNPGQSSLDHLKVSAKKCFIASQERLSAFSL